MRIWRGGCIIRSSALKRIAGVLEENPAPENILSAPPLADDLAARLSGWQQSSEMAARMGLPAPALASALAYYHALTPGASGGNLIQAQRDYFGAHGFERIDQPGIFHADWGGE